MLDLIINPSALLEIKLLVTLALIIIGWEVGGFFFYQYYRLKDEKVQLNRVLMAYGMFFILGFTCLLIFKIFILMAEDEILIEFFKRLGYVIVLFSLPFFWYFVRGEQFNDYLNPKLQNFLLFKSFIPIVAAIILPSTSLILTGFLGLIIIDGFFMIIFQYKLIKRTVAKVRKRFIMIFFTELLMFLALFLGAEQPSRLANLSPSEIEIMYFSGGFLMLLSEIIMFTVLLNFPSIMEFKWRDILIKLLIIDQKNNKCLYSYDFYEKDKSSSEKIQKQDKLFSGGLIGIDSVTAAITNTEGSRIKKIKHGDVYIIMEYGTPYNKIDLIYALVIKDDVNAAKFFLENIQYQFENFFKDILMNLESIKGKEELLFQSFNIILKTIL
ncbi:MAG: hypothetical protein ACTSQP_05365 [Promethearchaeota archaeon]